MDFIPVTLFALPLRNEWEHEHTLMRENIGKMPKQNRTIQKEEGL
jgi:hypothetical protein